MRGRSAAKGEADMCANMQPRRNDVDRLLVAMIAEVLLVCAVALGFFLQFDIPVTYATGIALSVLFAGSLICWRSQASSFAILGLSLLAVEAMLAVRFPTLVFPFAVADVILLVVVSGIWHTGEKDG